MSYDWDFSPVWRGLGFLLGGLGNTLLLSAACILLGLAIGLVLAVLRIGGGRLLAMASLAIVTFYRNTPPLVHLFFVFYGLPIIIGVSLSPFFAALIALSVQSGAFFAEIFRGGILSVERGQWEAGRAIGMGEAALLRRVILPQALRRMLPPLTERCFELVKTTALAASLSYGELLYRAMTLTSRSFRPLETYTAVALLFFAVLCGSSFALRGLEARLARAQR